jgi:hypothetical protein
MAIIHSTTPRPVTETATQSLVSQKGFSTGSFFDALHGKNTWHRANVRGLINQKYNELLHTKQLGIFQIPGGEDLNRLGMDKSTLIVRPDLYYQAYNEVLWKFKDKSEFLCPISTGTLFDLLDNENVKRNVNVRGLINKRYNQLLESEQNRDFLIQGSDVEVLGLNETTPIQRVDLYFQAYGEVLNSFEIKNFTSICSSGAPVIYSFDVGGTKTAYSIGNKFETFASDEISTPKGLGSLIEKVKNIFESVVISGRERVISISTPGNIKNGVIMPGSALLLEATDAHGKLQHEFDNLHLQSAISKVIPDTKILHSNDALAQFKGAVDFLNGDGSLNGKLVGYLGIGSGFGGGLGRIDAFGNLYCHTDGHVWDMRLKLDGEEIIAYSALGGLAFKGITGVTPKEVNENAQLLSKYTPHVQKTGRALSAAMIAIHQGRVKKMDSSHDWSEAELNQVRGTSHFLIGGSMGTKGEMSKIILETAQKEILKANLEGSIVLKQIPDAAGAALRGCQVLMEETLRTKG